MKKQKHGFWVFIFSLIPGAGEMYMGFKKQGIKAVTFKESQGYAGSPQFSRVMYTG